MYLSRVKLDESKKSTQIALDSPNKFHGAIENCFVMKEDRNTNDRKLWRIDRLNGNLYLLILSCEKPVLIDLIKQFGDFNYEGEIKDYNILLNRLSANSVWNFRIVANPTKSIKQDGKRGKVVAHISPKFQMEWLKIQAKKNGFQIFDDSLQVVNSGWKIFNKRNEKKIRLMSATFEGKLKINDVEIFKKALINGIGREKAYGMGLLTIMKGT